MPRFVASFIESNSNLQKLPLSRTDDTANNVDCRVRRLMSTGGCDKVDAVPHYTPVPTVFCYDVDVNDDVDVDVDAGPPLTLLSTTFRHS